MYNRVLDLLCLDIETSGNDPNKHDVLSIGAVHFATKDEFYVEIRHKEILAQPEAFRVHGLDIKDMDGDSKVPVHEAEWKFKQWLLAHRSSDRARFIPVGFNVSSFDYQFIKRLMPSLDHLLSYRSIELNSLLWFVDLINDEPDLGKAKESAMSFVDLKKDRKHNSLEDAKAAREILNNLVTRYRIVK